MDTNAENAEAAMSVSYEAISHLIPGIRRYADQHIATGSFLRAALENDFCEACAHADDYTAVRLIEVFRYLRNEIPPECWGSPEKVAAWLALRGQPTAEVQP